MFGEAAISKERSASLIFEVVLRLHLMPVVGSPAVSCSISPLMASMICGVMPSTGLFRVPLSCSFSELREPRVTRANSA